MGKLPSSELVTGARVPGLVLWAIGLKTSRKRVVREAQQGEYVYIYYTYNIYMGLICIVVQQKLNTV